MTTLNVTDTQDTVPELKEGAKSPFFVFLLQSEVKNACVETIVLVITRKVV